MPFTLNDKLLHMTPYDPVEGRYRIRLDANESFLAPPEEVRREIEAAVASAALNRYPDPLAKEVCEKFAAFYGVAPALVTAGNGSDELISILMSAFLQKGDRVMTLAPDFSMYRFYTSVVECPCVTLEKPADFSFPVDQMIETARREQVRLIVFSNPCNPTSVGAPVEEMRRLIRQVDSLVVLDEAYMDFWDQSLLQEAAQYDNLIVLRTCSKAFGLAAIRLGFAVANETLTQAIRAVKSPYNVNTVTQAIGGAVLSHPDAIRGAITKLITSRDELYRELALLADQYPAQLIVTRPDTNFVFLRCEQAGDLFASLKRRGIIVRRFGDYLRITAGRGHENAETVGAIRDFYAK